MKGKLVELIPFTHIHVKDKKLVMEMLKYEEEIATGEWGQNKYRDQYSRVSVSLDNEYMFNRKTLGHFGFNTNSISVSNYRTIFNTYFKDPDNYDKDVIDSSYYMRNNRCVFYREPPLSTIPNCRLYKLDGVTETDLYSAVCADTFKKGLICAFSNS